MKLNPAKCAFFIRGGKFFGYIVSRKGIEPNPEKGLPGKPSRYSDDGPTPEEDSTQAKNLRPDAGLREESSSEVLEKGSLGEPLQEFKWKLYVDGASSAGGSGAGIMLKGPEEFKVCYALRLEFKASNNVAENEALINGMLVAMEVGATDLEVNSDSQLVINQVTGAYQARDPTMWNYLTEVKAIEAELRSKGVAIKFQRIPREENEEADV
ncbi:uncharacterized protein LOC122723635 [Manihot esculenta]|uniref:uncharacterized protein LOC122723635 n=1 Tax=Manihot esculenta TaxID=3983 RepID=UPI001CC50FA3|nr:uncharacterized protein LOC122723635 [Manihot esculenta]